MDRKKQAKKGQKGTVGNLRQKWREGKLAMSKEKRAMLINAKRIRHSPAPSPSHSAESEDFEEVKIAQVAAAVEKLKAGEDTLTVLKLLVKAFAQGSKLIEHFVAIDGALDKLIGILSGSDSDLQLESVWCITNMAAGDHEQCERIAKSAAVYLVTYLSSGNHPLQEQCAWALANIAADSSECTGIIVDQGAITPLIKLLESSDSGCRQNAAFALSNILRGDPSQRDTVTKNALDKLVNILKEDEVSEEEVSEVSWVLSYLSASHDNDGVMRESGCVELMYNQLQGHCNDDDLNHNLLVTPVLRFLGNIFSGEDSTTEQILDKHSDVVSLITKFLSSDHRHVVKETLWVLSNLAANLKACEMLMKTESLDKIISSLSASYEVKMEAAYTLCNIALHSNTEWCQAMVDGGSVKLFIPFLKSHDGEEIHVTLTYFESMFRTLDCSSVFEEAGGLALIEPLEYHKDETIKSETNDILQKYFYKEEIQAAGDN